MTIRSQPLSVSGHSRALMTLGLPLVGSHLAQFAIGMTDTLMIGWYDVTALAALTVATSIYFVIFIVGSGFAWAVMPMVASAAGTDNDVQVRRVTRMGLWLSILFGLFMTPLMLFSEPLFLVMGQDPVVAELAARYLAIAGLGMIPGLLIMVLKSYLSALERTRVVLWVTIGSAVLNALVNYALIFGNWGAPEMGIAGAAVASASIQIAGIVFLIFYVGWATPEYTLFRNFHRPDSEAFSRVLRLGWPIGLTNLAEVGLFAASSIMIGWIGALELAAHGIALQIASAMFMIHLGLSQAVTVRVGRAYGAGDQHGLQRGAAVGFGISMAVALTTIILFLTVPGPLISLFLSPDDPALEEIVRIGTMLLAAAAVFQLVDAAQVMALGMLRGMQDTRWPMVIAALSYWGVGIPASYLLGFTLGWGPVGVWAGLAVGLALAAVFLSWRFWVRSSQLEAFA